MVNICLTSNFAGIERCLVFKLEYFDKIAS